MSIYNQPYMELLQILVSQRATLLYKYDKPMLQVWFFYLGFLVIFTAIALSAVFSATFVTKIYFREDAIWNSYCFNTSPSVFLVLIHAILTHLNTSFWALPALNKAIPPKTYLALHILYRLNITLHLFPTFRLVL